jgi:four helix bundle protein
MNEATIKKNLIVKLSFEFGLEIIEYIEKLESERKYVIAKQLLRSGTSIGANVWEAQNAESKADFIHKMKISAKEVEETQFWLLLCQYAKSYPACKNLLDKLESINKVITKIISTTKNN